MPQGPPDSQAHPRGSPLRLADGGSFVAATSGPGRDFLEDLARVAASPATVLLAGESGSGKSAAARWLHAAGPRAAEPFVEVHLAALSASLVESELFGHAEGAFTGAHRDRTGRFVRAHGGTLVLDAVDSLAEELQVKLLRVLQEQIVEPVGGDPREIDVRVIATTSGDLRAVCEAGRFRKDLYYRLAVICLDLPPLRARPADLPLFVEEFAARAARRARVEPRPFEDEALAVLSAHSWPGNLRELENAIERVLVLAPPAGGPVAAEELDFLRVEAQSECQALAQRALAAGFGVDELTLALIEEAVASQRGNLSAAARQVGLSRRALEYRLKRGLEEGDQ
jgi:Nif-specific regulatory protein